MKKSSFYMILQIISAVTVYSAASVWASANHVDAISNAIANINSLLVILAIAFLFPYLCFKALSKIYTPPTSRFRDEDSLLDNPNFEQDEINAIDQGSETMQYRGIRYNSEELRIAEINSDNQNSKNDVTPVIKYRGASIDNSEKQKLSPTDGETQKSAKPKERMKYRGSYID